MEPWEHRNSDSRGRRRITDDMTYNFASFNESVRRMFESLFGGLEQQYRQLGWQHTAPISGPLAYNFGSSIGQIVNDAEKFMVKVDVSQFQPNELSVSLRNDELTIEGNQRQQRDQHGTIERHFIRRYTLPDDVDSTTLTSSITENGILTVKARKKNVPATTPTRNIPIQMDSRRDQTTGSATGRSSSVSTTRSNQ